MTTFDSWEVAVRPPENYLMHHGIRGMKHGRNRYQNEDGTWTEEGLARRRQREGFGDGESRKVKRLQKKVERAEKHEARKAARAEARAAYAEKQRKKKLSNLTDEEMEAKLKRARMESEYRELTKKGTVLESGIKLVNKVLEYQDNKQKRVSEINKQKIEMERLKTQRIQAQKGAEKSENEAKKARQDAITAKYENRKARSKSERLKEKKNYKIAKGSYKIARKNNWKSWSNPGKGSK